MTTMASQITSLTVVYSTVYSDADQRKHQSPASLAFVWGIHRDRWIPYTKGLLRGKCFDLMTSSCLHPYCPWQYWCEPLMFVPQAIPHTLLVHTRNLSMVSFWGHTEYLRLMCSKIGFQLYTYIFIYRVVWPQIILIGIQIRLITSQWNIEWFSTAMWTNY